MINILNNTNNIHKIILMAMLPVIELRGAIPVGIALGYSHLGALLWAYLGSMIPVPFILLLFRPITGWMRSTKIFRKLVDFVVERAIRKKKSVSRYGVLGLLFFVAIPLPGTGVWSGSFIASLLDMRMKYALPVIALGNLIAGFIVLGISYGFLHIIN